MDGKICLSWSKTQKNEEEGLSNPCIIPNCRLHRTIEARYHILPSKRMMYPTESPSTNQTPGKLPTYLKSAPVNSTSTMQPPRKPHPPNRDHKIENQVSIATLALAQKCRIFRNKLRPLFFGGSFEFLRVSDLSKRSKKFGMVMLGTGLLFRRPEMFFGFVDAGADVLFRI